MDFQLTDDQKMLQEALQKFVEGEYDFDSRKKVLASKFGFSEDVWKGLAEQGVLGIGLPEEHGGLGGPVEAMVVMERFGAGLVLEPFMSSVVLCGGLIARHGLPSQQNEILPRIVDGTCRIALAHYEADARYDLGYVNSTARETADGYVLNGAKSVVLDGATATLLLVSARDESPVSAGGVAGKTSDARTGAARGEEGRSLSSLGGRGGAAPQEKIFIIDPSARGVEVIPYRTHDGRNAADIKLTDVHVAKDRLIAGGLAAIEEAIDYAIAALCAEAVGIMDAVNLATLEYLKTRVQFGQPIGRNQVLQHRMADMFMMAVQARSMSLLATGRCAANDVKARRHDVSAAKAFIGKAARFIGQQAVQLHGGMGMTAELIVSHYFKRLTLISATFGDVDHHVGIISDQMLAESK
jgi:alkylation response protein AidB-like acyl-CoA dehydrogenase